MFLPFTGLVIYNNNKGPDTKSVVYIFDAGTPGT